MSMLSIFRTRSRNWTGCTPPSAAERMARYSHRHAADMQARANASAAAPRTRLVDGKTVMIALPGHVNTLPATAPALSGKDSA